VAVDWVEQRQNVSSRPPLGSSNRISSYVSTAGEVRTFTKRVDTEVPALQRYILGFTGERRMVAVHAYVKKVRHRLHGNSR
jgi:hypothetical protein